MRKTTFFVLVLFITSFSLCAQKKLSTAPVAPGVSAATVERVVKALAADNMLGRATGKPGGQKAAEYLTSEFQRIGLAPLPGLTTFNQTFSAYESYVAALFVTLNGSTMSKDRVLLVSSQPHLNWTDEDEPATRVLIVGPQDKID